MPASRNTIGMALLAAALFGCGGSLNKGPDGSTGGACSTLGACECMAASDRCSARTEACWCPSECSPNIACICGGGRFLACQDKTAAVSCDAQVTRVKSMCAGMGFIDVIDNFCVNNPTCSAQCLSALTTTQSCAQFGCRFCVACDCAPPVTPNPLADCLRACDPPQPEL